MARLGKQSQKRLERVHPDLVRLVKAVIEDFDFTVLEGVRAPERQAELYSQGKSKTLKSKHLPQKDGLAHAVDLAPFPIDWSDQSRFTILGHLMKTRAAEMGIKIRWGGDWPRFHDAPHFELVD